MISIRFARLSVALLLWPLAACFGTGTPDRLVVPDFAYRFAGQSNRDIVQSLPASQAREVLTVLGRIDEASLPAFQPGDEFQPRKTKDAQGGTEVQTSMAELQYSPKPAGGAARSWSDVTTLHEKEILKSGFYFSTVTAVAIEDGLRPTAIPALILGFRPAFEDPAGAGRLSRGISWLPRKLQRWGVGYDLMVGGALNGLASGEDGNGDIELALGLGMTIPWSDAGALSLGVTNWRTETVDAMGRVSDDNDWAVYIGISLGGFNVTGRDR